MAEQGSDARRRDGQTGRRSASPRPPAGAGERSAAATASASPGPGAEVVMRVDGMLDTRGAERLRALIEDGFAPRRQLVLELSEVEHVSAAALAVLVAGHRRLRDGGGALVLRSPSPALVRELRISGLHRVIAVDPPEHLHP